MTSEHYSGDATQTVAAIDATGINSFIADPNPATPTSRSDRPTLSPNFSPSYVLGDPTSNPTCDPTCDPTSDPLRTALGVYVTVHGHFYQPPRENPYLNAIERQPSASPFHDWNERVHHECYRPNAFARILNDRGEVVEIVNNFEYLSFNIGPTLMSWMERYDIEVYQRILEADRKSGDRLQGHGNAIAQVYNHIIMPLANQRDKVTQIRWGKADFRTRFGRDPEGMWLAETAVDYATLAALVAEGIRFIVLAPSQAQRCRSIPTADHPDPGWIEVGGSQIDPNRAYRCYLPPEGSRGDGRISGQSRRPLSDPALSDSLDRITDSQSHELSRAGEFSDTSFDRPYIDIFFYDGPISRDMGFNDVLTSSQHLAGRIGQAVHGDHRSAQLVSVATDGETFGHHKKGAEKALAYALIQEMPDRGWTVTNYAHYLSLNPPTWEVELKPITAWSCSHGVDRWQDDCGCGGGDVWHQQWRRPLRDSLDWLRDQLSHIYEAVGQKFFRDPWLTRNDYIEVILDRSPDTVNSFLSRHQARKLSVTEKVDALRLLEMQRHALLMYTSCGWFFEEISRPEGTQILRYAARAIELAGDVSGTQLERNFVKRLTNAPSNVDQFQNGAEVYRQLVIPSQISLEQVAAHYAITSLFTPYPQEQRVYCYQVQQLDYQLQRLGPLTLVVGQILLTSEITREHRNLVFAVLHLGGWDFHCCIQPFSGRRAYSQMKETLFQAMQTASAAQTILAMSRIFGDQSFSLQDLFAEERHRIMRLLSQETLTRLDQLYTQVYRDNYGVLVGFHRDELEVPQELQVAAEIAISNRVMTLLQSLEREIGDLPPSNVQICTNYLVELEAAAQEAQYLRCHLTLPQIRQTLERLIYRLLWTLLNQSDSLTLLGSPEAQVLVQWAERLIRTSQQLDLHIALDRAQELYYRSLHQQILPQLAALAQKETGQLGETGQERSVAGLVGLQPEFQQGLQQALQLGKMLAVDIVG